MMRMKKISCCCLCSISVVVLVVLLHSVSTSQAYYLPAGGSTLTRTRTSTTLSTSQNDIFKHQKITKKSSISSRLALFASSQHRLSSSPSSSTTITTKKKNEISLEKNHPRLLVGEEGTTAPAITAVVVTILALTTVPDAATAAADAATATASASASASAALTYSSHYFGMFVSVGILVYERLSIRPYMPQKEEDTISTVNLFYSIIGILMIGSGYMAMLLYGDGNSSSSSPSGGGALDHYLHDTTPLFWFKMLFFAILTSASVFNSVTFTRRSLARALGTDIYVAPIGKQLANRMIQTCNIQIACLLVITLIAVGMTHGAGASIIQIIPSSLESVSWETYALIVCSIFVTFGIKNFFDALMFEENFGYLSNQYDTKVLYQQPQEEQQQDQQQQYGGSNTYFYPDNNNSFYNNNNNNNNNEYSNNEYGNYNYYNNDNGNDLWYNNDGNDYSNNNYNNGNDNNLWYKNSDGRISQGYVPQQLRGEGTTDDPTVRGNRVVTKFGGLMKVSDGIMPADENVPVTDRFIDQNQRRDNDRPITRQLQNIDPNTAREGRILYRDLVNPVPEYPSESVIDVTPLQQQPSPPNDLPSF